MKKSSPDAPKTQLFAYYEKYMLIMGTLGQALYYIQGIKIFITKSASDVSILGFLVGLISVSSWLVYGIFLKNKVLVFSNAVAVVGALFVVIGTLIFS